MTTRLALYNEALRVLGERRLASLSENREPRRLLDDVWDGGAVRYALEQGQWNFAIRTSALDYSPSIEPEFGYTRAFDKPDDFIRLAGISTSPTFNGDFEHYEDESGYWFADIDVLYVRYVSDDSAYGLDLSLWPETFVRYVATYLASEIAPRLTTSGNKIEDTRRQAQRRLTDARSKDAMGEPTRFAPRGNWVRARMGRGLSRSSREFT